MAPIAVILLIRLLIWLMPEANTHLRRLFRRLTSLLRLSRPVIEFETSYIEVKSFYAREFNSAPCINFIRDIEAVKALEYINAGFAGRVLAVYQRNFYEWKDNRQENSATIFKLENKVMIELGDSYAEILFANDNYDYANDLIKLFSTFKAPGKAEDFEINTITQTPHGLELKQLDIKPTELDIDLYYNDDFKAVDAVIKERLMKENDKGIILLHGLPGTGKTTYLRHLVGSIRKRVLFVSPAVAGNLMNPEFIDLLIDNPNAVVVIEDAENIIMDRKYNNNSSVSNLLNISDGLLSDCLNVQIICTFNSALSMVDSALLRKGRLIAKYEFSKLNVVKAQRLSDHLGITQMIIRPMTLAEITNPEDMEADQPMTQVVGFRREVLMN